MAGEIAVVVMGVLVMVVVVVEEVVTVETLEVDPQVAIQPHRLRMAVLREETAPGATIQVAQVLATQVLALVTLALEIQVLATRKMETTVDKPQPSQAQGTITVIAGMGIKIPLLGRGRVLPIQQVRVTQIQVVPHLETPIPLRHQQEVLKVSQTPDLTLGTNLNSRTRMNKASMVPRRFVGLLRQTYLPIAVIMGVPAPGEVLVYRQVLRRTRLDHR